MSVCARPRVNSNGRSRYIGSILVPTDEIALCLFEAPSIDAATELNERARDPVRADPRDRTARPRDQILDRFAEPRTITGDGQVHEEESSQIGATDRHARSCQPGRRRDSPPRDRLGSARLGSAAASQSAPKHQDVIDDRTGAASNRPPTVKRSTPMTRTIATPRKPPSRSRSPARRRLRLHRRGGRSAPPDSHRRAPNRRQRPCPHWGRYAPNRKHGSLSALLSPSWPGLSRPSVVALCRYGWPGQARP